MWKWYAPWYCPVLLRLFERGWCAQDVTIVPEVPKEMADLLEADSDEDIESDDSSHDDVAAPPRRRKPKQPLVEEL
jgi:hypothetical protein